MPRPPERVVVVGPRGVGKTSLLMALAGTYQGSGVPRVVEETDTKAKVDNETTTLRLVDTVIGAEFRPHYPRFFANARVCLVCFDLSSPPSLAHALDVCLPLVRERFERRGEPVPEAILVGTKLDAVSNIEAPPVPHAHALALVHRHRLFAYVPTSATWESQGKRGNIAQLVRAVVPTALHSNPHHTPQSNAWGHVWRRRLRNQQRQAEGEEEREEEGRGFSEARQDAWLCASPSARWKREACVALAMCRHGRLGGACAPAMRAVPNELWERAVALV